MTSRGNLDRQHRHHEPKHSKQPTPHFLIKAITITKTCLFKYAENFAT